MDPADPALASNDAMKRFTTRGQARAERRRPHRPGGRLRLDHGRPAGRRRSTGHRASTGRRHADGVPPRRADAGAGAARGEAPHTAGAADPYPSSSSPSARWDVTYFERTGDPVDFNGQTNDFVDREVGSRVLSAAWPTTSASRSRATRARSSPITMNLPERRNALSLVHLQELLDAFRAVGETRRAGRDPRRQRSGVLGRPRLRRPGRRRSRRGAHAAADVHRPHGRRCSRSRRW